MREGEGAEDGGRVPGVGVAAATSGTITESGGVVGPWLQKPKSSSVRGQVSSPSPSRDLCSGSLTRITLTSLAVSLQSTPSGHPRGDEGRFVPPPSLPPGRYP